jgi:hypothetical protein
MEKIEEESCFCMEMYSWINPRRLSRRKGDSAFLLLKPRADWSNQQP